MKRLIIPIFALLFIASGLFFISNSATYISDSQKQIIRDTKRLNDLTIFKNAIEGYKAKNGFYPKMDSGTDIKGYVNSSNVSNWNAFCNLLGLGTCPIDPVNEMKSCDCSIFNIQGDCSGDNNNLNLNKTTCYNFKTQQLACYPGSNIYQYKSINNGRNYEFNMEFEYRKAEDIYSGADYWSVNDVYNGNKISIDNSCVGVPSKIMSNAKPVCGDRIIQSGEECDGGSKIEFCTDTSGNPGKMAISCNSCKYEIKNTRLTSDCKIGSFCGDTTIQLGEECDGGYQKMCFDSPNLGRHDWYNDQMRYCQSNCKWDKNDTYLNSLTINSCGGYCGDDKVEKGEDCDFGVEYSFWDSNLSLFRRCSDYSDQATCASFDGKCMWSGSKCVKYNSSQTQQEKHCYIRNNFSCKYINTVPVFPAITNNNFTATSYVKSGINYSSVPSAINESDLFIKKVSRNSVYLEISLNGITVPGSDNISDIDGDELMYKFEFIKKSNNAIGFYKANEIIGSDSIIAANKGDEITGKWIKHSDLAKTYLGSDGKLKYTDKIFFRAYSTSLSKNLEEASKGILQLLDGTYFGDYTFRIYIKDSWHEGDNVEGNKQDVESYKDINFYIGSSCGDHVLQAINDEGQHEYCEWKSGYDKFFNWSVNEPSEDNAYCGAIKFKLYSDATHYFDWNAKWDNTPCSDVYYGLCKKDKLLTATCPDSNWIPIMDENSGTYTCYGLTKTAESYDAASSECYFDYDGSKLASISSPLENNLIKQFIAYENPNVFQKFHFRYGSVDRVITNSNPILWIGFYNIKKLRTPAQNAFPPTSNPADSSSTDPMSLWVSSNEDGTPGVYKNAVYNGGSGVNFSNQYLCSDQCTDVGGFCGDGILENGTQGIKSGGVWDSTFYTIQTNQDKTTKKNFFIGNFEQCDPSSQGKDVNFSGQTGLGTGWYLNSDGTKTGDSYGCQACSLKGGYCGSGSINNSNFDSSGYLGNAASTNVAGADYENCDPKFAISPKDSGNNSNIRGGKPSYICAASGDDISDSSDVASNIFKIPNPKTEAKVSWIPKNSASVSMTLQDFNAQPFNAKTFAVNSNGACQNSAGGYCGDGKIQMAYIGYQLSQNVDELYSNSNNYYSSTYGNGVLLYNDKDLYKGHDLSISRKIVIGTSNYRNSATSSTVITDSNKSAKYNYAKNNNGSVINDGSIQNTSNNWLERCDPSYFPKPFETNDLTSGNYYKIFDSEGNLLTDSDFNGKPTLRYECNSIDTSNPTNADNRYACDFKTYQLNQNDLTGTGDVIVYKNLNGSDYSVGYCGDGMVTGYGSNGSISSITNTGNITASSREQCDPKNHLVGPNGSDLNFGSNTVFGCRKNTQFSLASQDFVFGKDCSTYVTPATSSPYVSASNPGTQYECNYECQNSGGYCGDGVVQTQFYEQCDPGAGTGYNSTTGIVSSFSSANINKNYLCGTTNGYFGYSFDPEFQNNKKLQSSFDAVSFKSGAPSSDGKVASCQTFGGYCGDGVVQACKIENNFYGGSSSYTSCYSLNKSAGNLVADADGGYSFVLASGATAIESCDSTESSCFVLSSGNASRPALIPTYIDNYDPITSTSVLASTPGVNVALLKAVYGELVTYSKDGAGSADSSTIFVPAFDPITGTSGIGSGDGGSSSGGGTTGGGTGGGNSYLAYPSFDGVCGSDANAGPFSSTSQIKNLCAKGLSSNISYNATDKNFTWTCSGINGGLSINCSASVVFQTPYPTSGSCGSNSMNVCDEPKCVDKNGKAVTQGEQCGDDNGNNGGVDCIKNQINSNLAIYQCSVQCFDGSKPVNVGEACDSGRTCSGVGSGHSTGIKQKFSSADALSNKCNAGFAGDVSNNGTNWRWTCYGNNGSSSSDDVTCTAASGLAVKGVCNNSILGACSVGIGDMPKYSSYKGVWEWKCGGFNGGDFDKCSMSKTLLTSVDEDGTATCGSKNGQSVTSLEDLKKNGANYDPSRLCSKGYISSSGIRFAGTTFSWNCIGASSSNVPCSASLGSGYYDGACTTVSPTNTSTIKLCNSGDLSNVYYDGAFGKLRWGCDGVGVNATSSGPVKNVKCSVSINSPNVDGVCGSPFNMFQSSSGAQNPFTSEELKQFSIFGPSPGLSFKLCKAGYPIAISDKDNTWGNAFQIGENKGNRCDIGGPTSGNAYMSSDCIDITIKIPFVGNVTVFKMTMPWQWQCSGIGTGAASPKCFVFDSKFLGSQTGSCGLADGGSFADSAAIMDRCADGYAADFAVSGSTISWKCKGFNDGSTDSCSATIKSFGGTSGACGTIKPSKSAWSYYDVLSSACNKGVFSSLSLKALPDGSSIKWTWNCEGVSGGSTAICDSDILQDVNNVNLTSLYGECGNITGSMSSSNFIYTSKACNKGYVDGLNYDSNNSKWKWNCKGVNSNVIAKCQVNSGLLK